MKSTYRLNASTIAAASALALACAPASAGIYGSLANFDVVNDTGHPAYGFEIEIEDSSYDHTSITSVFGYDRVFSFISPDPGAVNRYGRPVITDLPGFGVRITYGGVLGANSTPSGIYATNGDSCWPGANPSWKSTSCDHFGVSTYGTPAITRYSWLLESAPGSGSLVKQLVGIPAVNFIYTPAPAGQPPAPVLAQIRAEAPDVDQPENEARYGEAFWVKVFKIKSKNKNIDLANLFVGQNGDDDMNNAEIESEWKIFQRSPAGKGGGNDVEENEVKVGDNDKAILRRYEFYKYLGPVTDEGEADCNTACEDNPIAFNAVGNFVGAQMAGFNLDEQAQAIAIPEPQTWALWALGLCGLAGLQVRRGRRGQRPRRAG